jgi:hypothetical protein
LRRLLVTGFAFLTASCSGVLALAFALIFYPTVRESGLAAAVNGFFYILDEAIRTGDPTNLVDPFFAAARAIAIAVCLAPLAFAALIGETMGLRQLAWYAGVSGVLAGASPWIARAAMGLDQAREATTIETRIALLFFTTGAFTGALYWLIAVPKYQTKAD